ncbi:MAG TPA: FAD-dependent oxidoreductase [Acidimicrobiales bacterium]|nr:FAD-dependent oxidoreductase [Acidimicrobiales bacterium]
MTDVPTSPALDASELATLESLGARRRVSTGDYLYRAGDAAYDFYVVLSGKVDILLDVDGTEKLLIAHGPGRFLGELNLLTGMRVFVSARVAEPGEVLAVTIEALRYVIAAYPQLSDKILATFMARRAELLTGASAAIRVVGSRFSPQLPQIRELLTRSRIPHEWLDPEADPQVDELLRAFHVAPDELPVAIAAGTVLRRVTPGALAEHLGLTLDRLPERCFDLVIVGGGPAGLAAAVYGGSEGLRTLGVEAVSPGGQAGTSSRIENYFGFPTGVSGADLTQRGVVQAEKFGAQLSVPCTAVALREDAGHLVVELSDGTTVMGRAVIAASGAHYRRLDVARLTEFESKGVFYAATELEARFCGRSPVVVVGGGNSAGQAAMFLAEQGCGTTVVIRGAALHAGMSAYLADRLERHPRITILTGTSVVALTGTDRLTALRLRGPDGETEQPCAALFSFIGADPQSGWLSGLASLDDRGFVLTDRALAEQALDARWAELGRRPLSFETSQPGLFAVGDLRSASTKRVAAAVGEGSAAVRSVHDYLAFVNR